MASSSATCIPWRARRPLAISRADERDEPFLPHEGEGGRVRAQGRWRRGCAAPRRAARRSAPIGSPERLATPFSGRERPPGVPPTCLDRIGVPGNTPSRLRRQPPHRGGHSALPHVSRKKYEIPTGIRPDISRYSAVTKFGHTQDDRPRLPRRRRCGIVGAASDTPRQCVRNRSQNDENRLPFHDRRCPSRWTAWGSPRCHDPPSRRGHRR